MKKVYWFVTNVYGKLFGWPFLQRIHHTMATFSLHALGYGNMYRESWTGEEWFLKRVLSKSRPNTIFDVGANVGGYSEKVLKYFDAEIHAFEPNPNSYAILNKLPSQVMKIESAVSNQNGEAVLNYANETDDKASLDSEVRSGNQVTVKCQRLDTYCQQNFINEIDFLKIDTEGFEKEVIQGLGDIRPKYIQFEFNVNHLQRNVTLLEITKLLPEYDFYRLLPNGWIGINPASYIDNIFIFSNFVAVREDN